MRGIYDNLLLGAVAPKLHGHWHVKWPPNCKFGYFHLYFVHCADWKLRLVKIIVRCLEEELRQPYGNPLLCHPINKSSSEVVVQCCKSTDFCNIYLSPKLTPRPKGNSKYLFAYINSVGTFCTKLHTHFGNKPNWLMHNTVVHIAYLLRSGFSDPLQFMPYVFFYLFIL